VVSIYPITAAIELARVRKENDEARFGKIRSPADDA
jgi:hypothetical protein